MLTRKFNLRVERMNAYFSERERIRRRNHPMSEDTLTASQIGIINPMNSPVDELKPCPFCGSENISIDEHGDPEEPIYLAGCDDCGAAISPEKCPETAIEAWNTRAESPDSGLLSLPVITEELMDLFLFGSFMEYVNGEPQWTQEAVELVALAAKSISPPPPVAGGELDKVIDLIKTLPIDCMGTGEAIQFGYQIEYPIRDEVINNLCKIRRDLAALQHQDCEKKSTWQQIDEFYESLECECDEDDLSSPICHKCELGGEINDSLSGIKHLVNLAKQSLERNK